MIRFAAIAAALAFATPAREERAARWNGTPTSFQEKKPPRVVGTWRWTFVDPAGEERKRAMEVRRVEGKWVVWLGFEGDLRQVKEFKLEGDQITVSASIEINGSEIALVYTGKIKDGMIEGEVAAEGSVQTWTPKFEPFGQAIAGVWRLKWTRGGEARLSTLKVRTVGDEPDAVFTVGDKEHPSKTFVLEGDRLRFEVAVGDVKIRFDGTRKDGKIEGTAAVGDEKQPWTFER